MVVLKSGWSATLCFWRGSSDLGSCGCGGSSSGSEGAINSNLIFLSDVLDLLISDCDIFDQYLLYNS